MMLAQDAGQLAQDVFHGMRLDLALKLGLAVLLGGAIGLERQIAGKAAGLRTNILICLGSAMMMDLSLNLAGSDGRVGDPARLAAQVITGIGFLGAGTIMQSKGTISGLTSAATIWTVAAIGLTVGAGFYIEGLGATAMVMVVLLVLGNLEHKLVRTQRTMPMTLRAAVKADFAPMEHLLADSGIRVVDKAVYDHPRDRVFELRLRGPAPQFDVAREALLEREDVFDVTIH
ncbi:MAG: MgtC/SapB family protein [Gemmatimonadetes bacterium]|nr:MgtC/SapB family protein [Gemmatimonadota bacterium]